jgi:hypothetical protein
MIQTMSPLSGTYAIASPGFISYGKTGLDFRMEIVLGDTCQQFVKCPAWRWSRSDNNFAFDDTDFYK